MFETTKNQNNYIEDVTIFMLRACILTDIFHVQVKKIE